MGNKIFEGEFGLKFAIRLTDIDGFKIINNERIIELLGELEDRREFKDVKSSLRAEMAWLYHNNLAPKLITTTSLTGDRKCH